MVPILSSLIFAPLVGAVIILMLPRNRVGLIKAVALFSTAIVLGLAIYLMAHYNYTLPQIQFVEQMPWMAPLNIWYFVGVDGLSLSMVFLTALLGFIVCISSFSIENRQKEYFVLYLLLMTGMTGTFLALDLFLFYIFW